MCIKVEKKIKKHFKNLLESLGNKKKLYLKLHALKHILLKLSDKYK